MMLVDQHQSFPGVQHQERESCSFTWNQLIAPSDVYGNRIQKSGDAYLNINGNCIWKGALTALAIRTGGAGLFSHSV